MARRRRLLFLPILLLSLVLAGCGSQQQSATPTATPGRIAGNSATQGLGNGLSHAALFVEPDDKRAPLSKPIRAATHTIDLTVYILTDHTIIHDLEYAQAKGVHVRVILEHHPYGGAASSRGQNQSAYDQLTAAGIAVHWAPSRFALTHEKTMIVDDKTAYILTLNLSASAFSKNREFGVVDQDTQDVQAAEAIFTADWNDRPYTPTDPDLFVSPTNSRADFVALLQRAQHSVVIYAEEVQDIRIEAAITAAQKRGAAVRLITNANDASNRKGLATLRAAGVKIHLLKSPYIHAKIIEVDDRWAFVGSENISAASLDKNRELGVLISNHAALARIAATFQRDWTR